MGFARRALMLGLSAGFIVAGLATQADAQGIQNSRGAKLAACVPYVTKTNGEGTLTLNICRSGSTTRVTGTIRDTFPNGLCVSTRVVISPGYSGTWKACDLETVDIDTGYQPGTTVLWTFVS